MSLVCLGLMMLRLVWICAFGLAVGCFCVCFVNFCICQMGSLFGGGVDGYLAY